MYKLVWKCGRSVQVGGRGYQNRFPRENDIVLAPEGKKQVWQIRE
jgi:hypothetical protein